MTLVARDLPAHWSASDRRKMLLALATAGGGGAFTQPYSGAVQRTVEDKLQEFVTVKDFGAKGDGITDDLTAFQTALDRVRDAGGGYVFVPQTNAAYILDGTLTKRRNVELIGFGAGSLLKLADGANVTMISATGATPLFAMRNLLIDGNSPNQTGEGGLTNGLINIALSATTPNFGINSKFGGTINDPMYVMSGLRVIRADGVGIRVSGAAGLWEHIEVLLCNGIGVQNLGNDMVFDHVNVGSTWHEGFNCSGASARFLNCKAFFSGTGGASDGTFGHYANGNGYRILTRGQSFVNCHSQDTDAPGFHIGNDDIILAGCYVDTASALVQRSTANGQNPVRGGGSTWAKVGINLQNCLHCRVDALVVDRGVSASLYSPVLVGALAIRAGAENNFVTLGYNPNILVNDSTPAVIEQVLTSYDQHNAIMLPQGPWRARRTLAVDDATPTVFGTGIFVTANANPTTITDFDFVRNGLATREEFFLEIADANTTVQNGANIVTKSGADITAQGVHRFVDVNGAWYEV